jgi:cytochrome P450
MTETLESVSFFDRETNKCPYDAHKVLRDEAPVWKDPTTGMFVLTRYEDLKEVLANPSVFTNRVGSAAGMTEKAVRPEDPALAAEFDRANADALELARVYEEDGWTPVPTLDALDAPKHLQLRRMFSDAFRPARIAALDPFVEALANKLLDAVIDDGRAEWVSAYAVPLPLYTIGKQMGVPEEDMPRIKAWTDAWVQRLGLMQTPEERLWSAKQEVEAQQYFQPIFERLRKHPENTLLNDLVNKEIPEWGRTLNDNELHSEMMADFFVGGSETTTSSLASGMVMLVERPDVWDALVADTEKYLPAFIEEVIRLEGPVQAMLRETSEDVVLHGVPIPTGSIVSLRFGAANRDERHYQSRAAEMDLERERPRGHLGFGAGVHVCLGAPLARREMYYGFKTVIQRIEKLSLPESNTYEYNPSYFLRGLKELHVEFTPRATPLS